MEQLTLFAEDSLVKMYQTRESGPAYLEADQDYGSSFIELLRNTNHDKLLSKTYPVYYRAMEDGTLPLSFRGWSNSGIAWDGGYLTGKVSEFPNADAGCSLSEVLEAEPTPPEYYLSQERCAEILRRAKENGITLPSMLREALMKSAQ